MPELKKDLENIKQKLLEHARVNYEPEKAEEFISSIESMNGEEFVAFLKEQGLIKEEKGQQCIFCSIVFGDIPSTKIGANEKAIAILDINPASPGHVLIIPKDHVISKEKIPEEAGKLALEVKEKLEKTFKPKDVEIISSNVMGHEILNVLPIYKDESLGSKRKRLSSEELEKIKEEITSGAKEEVKSEPEKEESESEGINERNTWLPKRFP
jgi:histidine triad (HIT) family protein